MTPIELDAYFHRIGFSGETAATLPVLQALQRCHVMSVPFENLDVQLGHPLTTSVEAAFHKIVNRRRGGWCYEQNGLFGAVLVTLGFRVTRLAAHVMRADRGPITDNSHLSLLVSLPGEDKESYLVDVGFGGSLLEPVPFKPGEWVQQPFRVGLRLLDTTTWQFYEDNGNAEFSFDFRPEDGDEAALSAKCLDLQQNPMSNFVQTLVVQKRREDERVSLRGRIFKSESRDGVSSATIDSADELLEALKCEFDLDVPDAADLWPRIVARHDEFLSLQNSS